MTAKEVVSKFWASIEARDWATMGALLAEDVVLEWPATRELIRGRANVVAVNAEYPDGWSINVLRLHADGETVVSEVEVPQDGVGVFRAVSWWEVRDGLIAAGREYWTTVGGDERPDWRKPYTELF